MTVRCPEGHESSSTDYCDTCGSPIGAGSPGPSGSAWSGGAAGMPSPGSSLTLPEPGPAASATQVCPHCGGVNVADALFCEACGYDFTTGTPPMGSEPVVPGPEVDDAGQATPEEDDEVAPEGLEGPAEVTEGPAPTEVTEEPAAAQEAPDGPEPTDAPGAAAEPDAPEVPVTVGQEPAPEPEPEPEPAPEPESAPEPAPEPAARPRPPRHTPPSRALADTWVVELWVDPDWYAVQQTQEACPSAGVPDIVLLTRSSALVGRPSGSLGVRPEVDAGADSAVSRRHAQLSSDGRRWWIEDLGSSNGTFVGRVGEPIPTEPLQPGLRVEIDRDDRIYVGAWTRLALRHATESEKRGEG